MAFTAKDVQALRQATGAGMMDAESLGAVSDAAADSDQENRREDERS